MEIAVDLRDHSYKDKQRFSDFEIITITRSPLNYEGMEKIQFDWEWKNAKGSGCIFLHNGVIDMNHRICRDSMIFCVSDPSRTVSLTKNDSLLLSLFEYILKYYVY